MMVGITGDGMTRRLSLAAAIESRISSFAFEIEGWAELRHSSNRARISPARAAHAVARRQFDGSTRDGTPSASIL